MHNKFAQKQLNLFRQNIFFCWTLHLLTSFGVVCSFFALKNLIKEKQKLIRENIDLYSNFFLEKINLRFVVLCKDLEVATIPALGVPNHPLKTIIININTSHYKLSRTIHHEIFHMINDQYKELFNYDEWKKFNSQDFKYQSCSTCTDKYGMELLNEKTTEVFELFSGKKARGP